MLKQLLKLNSPVIPASYVMALMNYLQAQGYDINEITSQAGLELSWLNQPTRALSLLHLRALLTKTLEITKRDDLGIQFGKRLNFTAHGELGLAAMTSPTGLDGLEVGIKYFKTRTPLLNLSMKVHEPHCDISASIKLLSPAVKHLFIDTVFASMHQMREFIQGKACQDNHIYLQRPQPKNIESYIELFGDNVKFNQPYNLYRFPSSELSLPLPLNDDIASSIAIKKCEEQLAACHVHEDLISHIKALFLKNTERFLTLDELAEKLCVSSRTLRRELQQFGTNYQTILDEIRQDMACNLLRTSDLSIVDIANHLQFSDSSNFANAFKKWTGHTPTEIRVSDLDIRHYLSANTLADSNV